MIFLRRKTLQNLATSTFNSEKKISRGYTPEPLLKRGMEWDRR